MGRFKLHKPTQKSSIDAERLLAELSNPAKLAGIMHHFEDILRKNAHFSNVRFDPEVMLERLDEISETNAENLNKLNDPGDQRREILKHLLPGFLSKGYLDNLDSTLLRFVSKKLSPADLKAISAASFFLELHRRNPGKVEENPLWDILFAVSYDEAIAKQERSISTSSSQGDRLGIPLVLDLIHEEELSDESRELIAEAVVFIDEGIVDLGFSLETILQGLRVYQKSAGKEAPEHTIRVLHEIFRKEIRLRELEDLDWGLELMAQQSQDDIRRAYQTVSRAIALPPIEHNPAVFGIYYKSVAQFYRFIKSDERDLATRILSAPDDIVPVLDYARWLLNQESPRRALKAFEAALEIDPESAWGEFGAAVALWRDGSFREARWRFARSARKSQSGRALYTISQKMSQAGDDDVLSVEAADLLSRPFQ